MIPTVRTKATYFEDRVSTKEPVVQGIIKVVIKNFENFCIEKYGKTDIVSEMKEMSPEQRFDVLQSWINWNVSISPGTVKNYFSKLKSYLHYMGIKLHPQDVREELTFKRVVDEELYPLSLNDIQTIIKTFRYKNKTQFICQLSSLMRIGEMVQIRKKNLIADKKNIIVKIPALITKFKKGRTTFFSKEASKMLRPILRKLDDNDLVFGSSETVQHSKVVSQGSLRLALDKTGLDMKYEATGRYMINTHSFRAYGITKISRHDPNFAKKLAGQKGYLLQYDRMNDEEKLELYQKYESELTIDTTEKQKADIERLLAEKEQLELNNPKFKNQSEQLHNLENEFMRMKFDLAELLRKEGKNSKLDSSSLSKYPDIEKHVKYGKSKDDIYIKDIDGGEILY